MAKWKINQAGLSGGIDYESGARIGESNWRFEQDERPFLKEAHEDRQAGTKDNILGAKKFATIPEIVAIEINYKYGIDIHAPDTLQDKDKMNKFKAIVAADYPHLIVNPA